VRTNERNHSGALHESSTDVTRMVDVPTGVDFFEGDGVASLSTAIHL
jgi:hypothetical protein